MNKLKTLKRPFLYALTISVGYIALTTILEEISFQLYVVGALVLYALIPLEAVLNKRIDKSEKEYKKNNTFKKYINLITLNHIFYPTFLYWGFIFFSFYYQINLGYITLVIILFLSMTATFFHYQDFLEGHFPRFIKFLDIYDYLSSIIIFLWTAVLINLYNQSNISDQIFIFVFFAQAFIHLGLKMLRIYLDKILETIILGLGSLAISIIFYLFFIFEINELILALIVTVFFEIINLFLNSIQKKELKLEDLLDFAVVILLLLSILNLIYL